MAKRVDVGDFPKIFKEYNKELGEDFKKAVAEEVVESVSRLVQSTPVDTGLAASSWDYEITKERIVLGNTAPHFPILEFGAPPFKPPIGVLLEWAARVLQSPPDAEGRYSEEVRGLAFGTQKKIMEHGMEPHYILTDEVENINKRIKRRVEEMKKEP